MIIKCAVMRKYATKEMEKAKQLTYESYFLMLAKKKNKTPIFNLDKLWSWDMIGHFHRMLFGEHLI